MIYAGSAPRASFAAESTPQAVLGLTVGSRTSGLRPFGLAWLTWVLGGIRGLIKQSGI